MFEDDEFCHRAKAAGYKCIVNEGCYVYHKGSASFSKIKTSSYQTLFEKNKIIYKEKTGLDWTFSGILKEYLDYTKFAIEKAIEHPEQALKFAQNAKKRVPSLEWLVNHIKSLELAQNGQNNSSLNTVSHKKPLPLTAGEVLSAFGTIRRNYINSKKVVIFPPTIDWSFMTQRPQQLAKAFVKKGYAVIYLTQCAQSDAVDFYEFTSDNVLLMHQAFSGYLNHLIFPEETTFFCVWPTNLHYTGTIPHAKMVYDYIDDISLLEGEPNVLKAAHLEAMNKANLITVSARLLDERVPEEFRSKTLLIPNAVSDDFIKAAQSLTAQPHFIKKNLRAYPGQKTVGYVGAIAEWMDFGLIEELLLAFPEVQFIFIGPILPGGTYIKNLPHEFKNITLIPEKAHVELPHYISQFDICIIPFLLNKITHAVSPVKLFEYAAFGKPIITTAMRECKSYKCIRTADSHSEFLSTLRDIQNNERSTASEDIYNLAFHNTWSKRVDVILENVASRPYA